MLCISLAMQRFLERQLNGKLFLNISPSVLLSLGTRPLLETAQNAGMSPLLIVIELTENHPAASGDDIIRIVKSLKSLGFMVAIDDLGAGNSGLRLWSELRPDFVKLDIYFAANIDQDATKRQFVASLCDLAGKLGCHMILEGVERKEEYLTARDIGIQYCQGYLFGKPALQPAQFPTELFIEEQTEQPRWTQVHSTLSTAKIRAKGTPGHIYCLDNQRFDFSTAAELEELTSVAGL